MSRSGKSEPVPPSSSGTPEITVEVPENVMFSEPERFSRAPWPITSAMASGSVTGISISRELGPLS